MGCAFRGGEVVTFPWPKKGAFFWAKRYAVGPPFYTSYAVFFFRLLGCQMWMKKEETEETLFFLNVSCVAKLLCFVFELILLMGQHLHRRGCIKPCK